jgi:transcriptional regulator with XRE-family HTH domain
MSATTLAERAFITRETLRNIETGIGTPRIDSLFAVLSALGIADAVVTAIDPITMTPPAPESTTFLEAESDCVCHP